MQELIELYRPNHAIMKEFGWWKKIAWFKG
jgi:hypothetical protein